MAHSGWRSSSPASSAAASDLKLTEDQKKRLAEIDRKQSDRVQALRKQLADKRAEAIKLIDDPKASDRRIRKKVHELADIQAEVQLVSLLADRERNKVYTAEQRATLAKSGGCGCGGGSSGSGGGCGSGCGSGAPTAMKEARR